MRWWAETNETSKSRNGRGRLGSFCILVVQFLVSCYCHVVCYSPLLSPAIAKILPQKPEITKTTKIWDSSSLTSYLPSHFNHLYRAFIDTTPYLMSRKCTWNPTHVWMGSNNVPCSGTITMPCEILSGTDDHQDTSNGPRAPLVIELCNFKSKSDCFGPF